MKNSTIISWLISVIFSVSFSVAVPPQSDADRALLSACRGLEPNKMARALCMGANSEITDQEGKSLYNIVTDDNIVAMRTSVAFTDDVRECQEVLYCFPAIILNRFALIDAASVPKNHHFDCKPWQLGCINGVDYLNDTIIHRAIRGGEKCDHIVKKIISLRGWFNWHPNGINTRNKYGDTPLHLVMKQSEIMRSDEIVMKQLEPKRSEESRRRMCLFLVSRGANAGIKNNDGMTPITYDPVFWLSLCSSVKPEKSFSTKCKELFFCKQRSE